MLLYLTQIVIYRPNFLSNLRFYRYSTKIWYFKWHSQVILSIIQIKIQILSALLLWSVIFECFSAKIIYFKFLFVILYIEEKRIYCTHSLLFDQRLHQGFRTNHNNFRKSLPLFNFQKDQMWFTPTVPIESVT